MRILTRQRATSQTSASEPPWLPQDLQSLPLPVFLHEPTTELMKAAEDVEHSHLLDEARWSRQPGSPAENSHRLLRGHKAHVPPKPAEYLAPTAFISACSIRPCRNHAGRVCPSLADLTQTSSDK